MLFAELFHHFVGPIQAAVRHQTYRDWLVCNVAKGWVFCKKIPTSHLHQRQHEKLNYCKGKGVSIEMMLPHRENWISLCRMTLSQNGANPEKLGSINCIDYNVYNTVYNILSQVDNRLSARYFKFNYPVDWIEHIECT